MMNRGDTRFDSVANPGGAVMKTSNTFPPGCIVKLSDAQLQFNTPPDGVGRAQTNYKKVCSTPNQTFPALSNYTDASGTGRLCSRTRRPCNANPGSGQGCRENIVSEIPYATYYWTEEPCRVQAQVHIDGRVALVHPGSMGIDAMASRMQPNSENWFRVDWLNGLYPAASKGCASSCTVHARSGGDTCLCDTQILTAAPFTDTSVVPTQAQIEQALFIGAAPPEHFAGSTTVYSECTSAACAAASPDVKVYTVGTPSSPVFDMDTIFEIVVNRTALNASGSRVRRLINKVSRVSLAAGVYSFRNPPQFMTLFDGTQRDAQYETDALLEHLFYHPNVGPFLAIRIIQHLVSSNPSPRYVTAAVTAFRTGVHGGRTYSGAYGDIGAMTAAIVLDREARSLVLTADPTHGHIREPMVKLLHLMRAMEYLPNGKPLGVELITNLVKRIGQAPYRAPSVFNFYQPEYVPFGPMQHIGLVAPEAQLGVLPYLLGFYDGVSSMLFDGLSSCEGGFFQTSCNTAVHPYPSAWANKDYAQSNAGYLAWTPSDASTSASVVAELDVLFTAGRLDEHAKAVITDEFEHAVARSSCPNDRSAELCGRLTSGQELAAGDSLTNSLGETLCFTYDGVARHIGANGKELFSTAVYTRGRGVRFTYDDVSSETGLTYVRHEGTGFYWRSSNWNMGNQRAFHSFLSGPCKVHDEAAYERFALYSGRTDGFDQTEITCLAADTCAMPAPATPSATYVAERARTDAAYAVRMAANLLSASAAFSTDTDPLTRATLSPPYVPRQTQHRPYKALVVLFLRGGADTFNLLVPKDNCDSRQVQAQYQAARGDVALNDNQLLEIDVPAGTQPCDKFGIHYKMPTLRQLYVDNEAAIIANAGCLMRPTTKEEYLEGSSINPPQLFAHNTQQKSAETLEPQNAFADGVVGRLLKALDDQAIAAGEPPLKTISFSVTPNKAIFAGAYAEPVILDDVIGMLTFDGSATALKAENTDPITGEKARTISAIYNITGHETGSVFAHTHNSAVRQSFIDSASISGNLEAITLTSAWPTNGIANQLKQVATVIAARNALEAERAVFLVEVPHLHCSMPLCPPEALPTAPFLPQPSTRYSCLPIAESSHLSSTSSPLTARRLRWASGR